MKYLLAKKVYSFAKPYVGKALVDQMFGETWTNCLKRI